MEIDDAALPPLDRNAYFTKIRDILLSTQEENDDKSSVRQQLIPLLLQLKQHQHARLQELESSQHELDRVLHRRDLQERRLRALQLEDRHLTTGLEQCRNFEPSELVALAKEEAGSGESEGSTATREQERELLTKYLQADVHDPSQKQRILAKLHTEITARGTLARDVQQQKKELLAAKKELASQTMILKALPDQLSSLERSTLPLQRHLNKNSTTKLSNGTEQRLRLQLAHALPPPLYTLFQHFQFYLDRVHPQLKDSGDQDIALNVSGGIDDPQVLLELPVQSPTGVATKRVTIQFRYDAEAHLVTAVPTGCGTTLYPDLLLEELLPGDTSDRIVVSTSSSNKRPSYHWCNYLAGIALLAPQTTTADSMTSSLRVVFAQLLRRLRAQATLKHLLHSLQRLHIPSVPGKTSTTTTPIGKVMRFEKQQQTAAECNNLHLQQTFSVQLAPTGCSSSSPFCATVTIAMARYPLQPPVWSLASSESSATTTSPLFDATLADLERFVNISGLQELLNQHTTATVDDTTTTDEVAYEWILLYQLRHLLQNLEGSK